MLYHNAGCIIVLYKSSLFLAGRSVFAILEKDPNVFMIFPLFVLYVY